MLADTAEAKVFGVSRLRIELASGPDCYTQPNRVRAKPPDTMAVNLQRWHPLAPALSATES